MKTDPYLCGRPVTMGTRHMAASSHYLASLAGYDVLEAGGSAADAVIAINAVLAVVYPHMSGLGGDFFCQVWDPREGQVRALNASGRSAARASIELYRSRGHAGIIPVRGPLAALTVPGAIDGWWELHQRYGRLDWERLFQPAIRYAGEGFPLTPKFQASIAANSEVLSQYEATAAAYLPGGRPPKAGAIFRQPDLGRSLRLIAAGGREVGYRGELGEAIVRGLQQAGGLLTMDDLASHTSEWVDPLRSDYRGYEISELPPNTQGIAVLLILNLLEGFDLQAVGEGTADYYHLMTEAVKLAYADRDRWVTDPTCIEIPYERLLSKEYARQRRAGIDMQRAAPESQIAPGDGGDTAYFCAVDSDGLAVSAIQSLFWGFGSAFMPPGTGLLLQNRGSYFSLDENHPNALAPRKRTFHTIIPAMALKDSRPVLVFGSMGGEGQPQTQTALVTRIIDFGCSVQQAIELPRILYGRTWGQPTQTLKLESNIPGETAAELSRRGHDVEIYPQWSPSMGHAQAIWIDQREGVLHGGADPRGEGLAVGR